MVLPITMFAVFALIERFGRGYRWPSEPYWVVRGIVWMVLMVWGSDRLSGVVHELLGGASLFDLEFMGLWGVIPSFFLYEFLLYGYHRALHGVPVLWRIHQWHHSSERLDVWSTYRINPLEVIGYVVISYLISVGILGVTGRAAYWTGLFILVIQSLQHTNLRTPVWLGYVIARPENHMLHHARELHHANYSDLPIVDALFGTFELPRRAPEAVGFWDGASRQIGPLLRCEDLPTRGPR